MIVPLFVLSVGTDLLAGDWRYEARETHGKVIASGVLHLERVTETSRKKLGLRPTVTYVGRCQIKVTDRKRFGPHDGRFQLFGRAMQFDFKNGISSGSPPRIEEHVEASQKGSDVFIDLNAPMNDDNIWLKGHLDRARIEGKWGWATFAGYRASGPFTLTRLPRSR